MASPVHSRLYRDLFGAEEWSYVRPELRLVVHRIGELVALQHGNNGGHNAAVECWKEERAWEMEGQKL